LRLLYSFIFSSSSAAPPTLLRALKAGSKADSAIRHSTLLRRLCGKAIGLVAGSGDIPPFGQPNSCDGMLQTVESSFGMQWRSSKARSSLSLTAQLNEFVYSVGKQAPEQEQY
jgi:hypothetical protein